ncbi:MAG: DUF3516 domain-containing protein [Myxococcales bacterium]|nr:DUF3516 domain-containing protein [Myxococcales bacterium]
MTTVAPLLRRLPPLGEILTDGGELLSRFIDYTGELGIELYPAQEEALLELFGGKNVILATPTGSGKSLVATAMHFLAMAANQRSVYTSPIKALVNEKFFALCETFHPDNVGLLTGDATVNRDAPIICCTAEILANWALAEGDTAKVAHAVLDEFHYYSDRERGVAWQVPLLALRQTTFLLMSATLGDTAFFERAITKLNRKPTVTVRSSLRPVPLDYEYAELPLHETIATLLEQEKAPVYVVSFTQRACHEQAQNLTSVHVANKEKKRAISEALIGHRFDTPYGKILQRFLRHGVGVHHGGMLPKYRRLVERLAQAGLLDVISGTDTLGVGVNIPIRTVLLTQLCKYDGAATRVLNVREFHQLCGRAGRKGFDDQGSVVAQAPEHAIENLRLERKASASPDKKKKIVRQKPPERGYAHYTRETFDRLIGGVPEPLSSRFSVSHAMLLEVLGRDVGGCAAMKALVRECHETPAQKRRIGRDAMGMLRSLVIAEIVELAPDEAAPSRRRLRVNVDLQEDFSLHHALSLYLYEAVHVLEPELETYPLDVLAMVEAILEDPRPLLEKQLDRIKRDAIAQWKADGVEYDERMQRLEKLEWPKPNSAFIYGTFDGFAAKHPWARGGNVHPKGVARELFETCQDFNGYIVEYGLERHEGLLLRYLSDVYKALTRSVPERVVTPELEFLIHTFEALVRGVDASLVEEWERMRDPQFVPVAQVELAREPERDRGIAADERSFTVLIRNAMFGVVRALACRDYGGAAQRIEAREGEPEWTSERLAATLTAYYEEHEALLCDVRARGTRMLDIDKSSDSVWVVRQTLCDPEGHDDWYLRASIDLERASRDARPVLVVDYLGA